MDNENLPLTHRDNEASTTCEKCKHTHPPYNQAFIDGAVQRANKYRQYTRWTATTCSVLAVACLRYCLLSSGIWIVPSPYAIFCLPLPAMAFMEILLHTGLNMTTPVSGMKIELVPRILPNDAETAWHFEGEGSWPCQRDAILRWWYGFGKGRGWRKCFLSADFAIVAAYSCFTLLCLVWTWVEIKDLQRRMQR